MNAVDERVIPQRYQYVCSACLDTGFRFVGERQDGKANCVVPCVCRETNPKLRRVEVEAR